MASNGSATKVADSESSLEKIKRQLTSGSGRFLLQGPLLKRSETLRKWNERWVILDPTTGKMEYKIRRTDPLVKGTIVFDSNSTITLSPLNFNGLPKYSGCCLYIGTPQKKEYFLCAETPGAARAWVYTLHATQLVLRAHREAVNNLSGNGSATFGTVATVVAAANSTAMEASKEIEAAMKISLKNTLGARTNNVVTEGPLDDLSIMKETLMVKDEELEYLAKDIRARDSTIKEIAEKLTETAKAAEAAAFAAHAMDEERRLACAKIEQLTKFTEKQAETFQLKLKESEDKAMNLGKERELLLKQRDSALQEAHMWRTELAKAREHAVIFEAAVLRAEERARTAEADAESRIKDAAEKVLISTKEKEELLALIDVLQSQVQRQQSNTKQVCKERSESCSGTDGTLLLTKHVDTSEDNVDKACLNDSRPVSVSTDRVLQLGVDGVEIHSIGETQWGSSRSTQEGLSNVRDIPPEADGSSMDIPVIPDSDNPNRV